MITGYSLVCQYQIPRNPLLGPLSAILILRITIYPSIEVNRLSRAVLVDIHQLKVVVNFRIGISDVVQATRYYTPQFIAAREELFRCGAGSFAWIAPR